MVLLNNKLKDMSAKLVEDNMIVSEGDNSNLAVLYIRPTEDTELMVEKLAGRLQLISGGHSVVAGDFNARLDRPEDARTAALKNTLNDFGFWLIAPPIVQHSLTIWANQLSMSSPQICHRTHALPGRKSLH